MRILIADDHELLRDTLVLYLESQGGFETEAVGTLDAALKAIAEHGPFDLVLLDLNMPGMDGLDGLERAIAASGDRPVALMSGVAPRHVAEQALAMGAAGFLPKSLSAKSLVNAVRFMISGEQFVPAELMTGAIALKAHPLIDKLTPRERDALRGLLQGKSNKEIARDLGLHEATVKLHMKKLYRKIGAQNRTQAALIAREVDLF